LLTAALDGGEPPPTRLGLPRPGAARAEWRGNPQHPQALLLGRVFLSRFRRACRVLHGGRAGDLRSL